MDWAVFLVLLVACGGAGMTGGLFPPGDWYERLDKPAWTPPNWLFPVAWTTLYLCMGVAGARVAGMEGSGLALALWAAQIAWNGLWTPVFFGLRRMGLALVVLGILWLLVAACLVAHWSVDTLAGALFVPYLLWVSVAGALNWSVWRRNPDAAPA